MQSSIGSSTFWRRTAAGVVLLTAIVLLGAAGVRAAEDDPPGSHRDWGVRFGVRAGGVGSGYGDFLEKATAWDMGLFKQHGLWRYGVGLTFGSLGMQDAYDEMHEAAGYGEEPNEWAHFETYGYAERVFRNETNVRPYLQGRLAIVRTHPRSELFLKKPVEELESGESPTDAVNGLGVSLIPGVEFDVSRSFAVDLSAYLNFYVTEKYNLDPIGLEDTGTGTEWGLRVGGTWRPISFEPGAESMSALEADRNKDGWGVTRSWGWATAEVLAINFGASMFNEYVRQANFNQISPRSFWHNIEEGFKYDDNQFKTNQMIHPFNGSTYFNSGRANGLGYWSSSFCALLGAFVWEAAGETHPMSINDMASTGIGGMAFGEAVYRMSSRILDNTAAGNGRTWREIGAFLVDPVRGFNRFLSGQATRVQGNPSDPYDKWPPHYRDFLAAGVRVTGRGESIHDSTQTQAVVELYMDSGSPWENERRKPFDHFDVGVQFNGNDKVPVGRFQIRGDLFSKAFGGPDGTQHAIAFVQYFDYINNNAYEFGGQSFGGALFSRFQPSQSLGIRTRLDLSAMILGAVNSEYAYIVETEEQERLREYDYGPGAGASIEASGFYKGRPLLTLAYRFQWINVKNGSVYLPADESSSAENPGGSDAEHFIHSVYARLTIPIRSGMSVGMDGAVFLRESYFSREDFVDTNQRVPQARLYLAWGMGK
jgi:hypothetical protein